jgi:acyl-CoA-binding protein
MNVLDYVNNEIKKLSQLPNNEASLKVYNEYKIRLIDSGAKPSKP